MIYPRVVSLLQTDFLKITSMVTANLRTSQFLDGKKRESKDKSCEPVKVAIILSGCGYLDGTEISETMSATFHICDKNMIPQFYAPDVEICQVVNHLTKEADSDTGSRNTLVESARLARSCIKPLCECQSCKHGALLIPGGCGAVKTLSDFAAKGANCTVLPDLEKLIEDFYCDQKPIATLCIASVIVARVLKGVKVTLGKDNPREEWPHADAIEKVKEMGAKIEMKDVKGVTRSKKYNVFSTPAWLYGCATYSDIHYGIGKLVTSMKKCIRQ